MERELKAIHDHHKEFYGKAIVITCADTQGNTIIKLRSYSTIVAEIVINRETGEKKLIVHGLYSATTTRHIKEFIQQNGFSCGSVDFIRKMYM